MFHLFLTGLKRFGLAFGRSPATSDPASAHPIPTRTRIYYYYYYCYHCNMRADARAESPAERKAVALAFVARVGRAHNANYARSHHLFARARSPVVITHRHGLVRLPPNNVKAGPVRLGNRSGTRRRDKT